MFGLVLETIKYIYNIIKFNKRIYFIVIKIKIDVGFVGVLLIRFGLCEETKPFTV